MYGLGMGRGGTRGGGLGVFVFLIVTHDDCRREIRPW